MTPPSLFHVIVLELDDVVARIRPDRPNLYIGISTHTPEVLAGGLADGQFRPTGHAAGLDHLVRNSELSCNLRDPLPGINQTAHPAGELNPAVS